MNSCYNQNPPFFPSFKWGEGWTWCKAWSIGSRLKTESKTFLKFLNWQRALILKINEKCLLIPKLPPELKFWILPTCSIAFLKNFHVLRNLIDFRLLFQMRLLLMQNRMWNIMHRMQGARRHTCIHWFSLMMAFLDSRSDSSFYCNDESLLNCFQLICNASLRVESSFNSMYRNEIEFVCIDRYEIKFPPILDTQKLKLLCFLSINRRWSMYVRKERSHLFFLD